MKIPQYGNSRKADYTLFGYHLSANLGWGMKVLSVKRFASTGISHEN